jgi:hypothetical protein
MVIITRLLDFIRRSEFLIIQNTPFRMLYLLPFSGEGRQAPILLGPLERANHNHNGPNRGVSFPSPEEGNRYRIRNVVVSKILEDLQSLEAQ